MQEKSNVKVIIIVIFCVVVLVGLGLGTLSFIKSVTGIGGSNSNANTNATQQANSITPTPVPTEVLQTKDRYITDKLSIVNDRINDNTCSTKNTVACKTFNDIKKILEATNKEQDLFPDFKNKCLDAIKPSGNEELLKNTCNPLITTINKPEQKNPETEILHTSSNSDLTKLTEEVKALKTQLDGVSKDSLNEINNNVAILKWLLLFLFILIGSLIGYQIWNQTKLTKKLEEVEGLIGLPDNKKTLANIVSEAKDSLQKQITEGKDKIQNKIINLSEIISSSNLTVKEQMDEIKRQNLEEARKREEEQNRNNIITIPIDNSYTQSNEQQSSNIESEYEALKGLVSDIQNRFAVKPELTKHPYPKTLKPISSSSETVTFFSITIEKNGGMRTYAIPKATRINSSGEATHLNEFYTLHESNTGDLNGKLNIKEPAEIKWNEDIKGWELVIKGEIKIVS
ncbi:MAG TPA: hypothetical protein PKE69_00035 [Pyrinomonadaceae bacterium]|nr:hypothetical protein [Pyrinomonadaceae bacterium]